MDLLKDGQLAGQIAGADGRGPLMDDVLEKVRHAVEARGLLHGADPDPQVGGHAGHPVVLDDQDRESVGEPELLDLERGLPDLSRWGRGLGGKRGHRRARGRPRLRIRRRGPCEGSDRADGDDEKQDSSLLRPLFPGDEACSHGAGASWRDVQVAASTLRVPLECSEGRCSGQLPIRLVQPVPSHARWAPAKWSFFWEISHYICYSTEKRYNRSMIHTFSVSNYGSIREEGDPRSADPGHGTGAGPASAGVRPGRTSGCPRSLF